MHATRITIDSTEADRHAIAEVIRLCAALGANQIESVNPNVLAFTGLAYVVATMTRQPAVLEAFINRVRRLQAAQQADPCHDTGDSAGCATGNAGRHSGDAKA